MHFTLPVFLILLLLPVLVFSWGDIDDISYKVKGADGNRWEHLLGVGEVIRGDECPGTLTFTFDDGPDHRTTPLILDQLDRYDIKAAFFINGTRIHRHTAGGAENRTVLRDLYRRGHFIGNHTYSHKDVTALDEDGWRIEVSQVELVTRSIIGRNPKLFRPPFGSLDRGSLNHLIRDGYSVVMWNLDSLDWKASSPLDLFARTRRLIEANPDGGVLLFHDTNSITAQALPLIIEWIQERNSRLRAAGERPLKIVGMEHYLRRHCR